MTVADQIIRAKNDYDAVYVAGYEKGKSEGGDTETAYNNGFEDGKQVEYDRLWDAVQENGNRRDYYYAFAYVGFDGTLFSPKYPIICEGDSSSNGMFYGNGGKKIIEIKNTIEFKTSAKATFMLCNKLKTIYKVIVYENTTFDNNVFNGTNSLENITFEGVIGQNGLNLQWSTKLTRDSLVSIINCLSNDTSDLTVTLSLIAVKKAFETSSGANDGNTSAEWLNLIATKSNWTIALV